jgi:hypothetical protein
MNAAASQSLLNQKQGIENKFLPRLLQQKLAEQTGNAQIAGGLGQQEQSKGAISPQMVQAQLQLAQQHAQLAQQHTIKAQAAANVAQKTQQALVSTASANASLAKQTAAYEQEKKNQYPGLVASQKLGNIAGGFGTISNHWIQSEKNSPVFNAFKNAITSNANSAMPNNSAANNAVTPSVGNTNNSQNNLNADYFIKNPNAWVPHVAQTYDAKYGKGSWSKASIAQRKKFGDNLGQSFGLK